MKTIPISGPALNPVSLVEAKAHLNLLSTFTTDDALINNKILTATELAEKILFRRLVRQTWNLYLDGWTGCDPNRYLSGGFYLPYGQLQSVTHIKYTDTDEDQTTWADTEYDVDTYAEPGAAVLAYDKSFPTAVLYPTNPIEVQFVCGWYQGSLYVVSTEYSEDDYVVPTTGNGFVYQSSTEDETSGTSHTAEPTWPTLIDGTVVDNDITWTCVGRTVPYIIKQAIFLMITDMYELRETNIIGQGVTINTLKTVENLLIKSKLWEF